MLNSINASALGVFSHLRLHSTREEHCICAVALENVRNRMLEGIGKCLGSERKKRPAFINTEKTLAVPMTTKYKRPRNDHARSVPSLASPLRRHLLSLHPAPQPTVHNSIIASHSYYGSEFPKSGGPKAFRITSVPLSLVALSAFQYNSQTSVISVSTT